MPPEIINAEAAALALLAVEDLPLHGDHFLCNHVRVMAEQRIRYSNFFQIGDRDLACHNVEPPLVVKRLRKNRKRKRGIRRRSPRAEAAIGVRLFKRLTFSDLIISYFSDL